ncbi:MAG: cryptochrome/photolyase family protein [Planctomycetota bacterium]
MTTDTVRRLGIILGDQLDESYPAAMGLDPGRDMLLMMEVAGASRSPASSIIRTAVFLSSMRHHAQRLREAGWSVEYVNLDAPENTQTFGGEIGRAIQGFKPESVSCVEPGSHALDAEIRGACEDAEVHLDVLPDPHFLCNTDEFADWAAGRKSLTMEYFYRAMRKRLGVLMDDGEPEGGTWNLDKENRKAFKSAPGAPPIPVFDRDAIIEDVLAAIDRVLPDLPGRMGRWIWPVTREQALECLADFIDNRLKFFGDHQDAMWTGEHTLYHSVISAPLNLKLLNPREVYAAAETAYQEGKVPLNAAEGFIRQIIGWREFIRGVYTFEGPSYGDRNGLEEHGSLPDFYWTGETDMRCMRDALESVLDLGYGHHIARLMVTGNFAMIAGVHPIEVNDWYLGMYADGVEWVTTPNTLGMAMHADHGIVGTKPYAASGKYIKRMSNYCKGCRYDVSARSGDDACPFNVFYWDFLNRHSKRFSKNTRMTMMLKNLDRIEPSELTQITVSAGRLRERFGIASG